MSMAATDPVNPTDRVLQALAEHGNPARRSGNGWSAKCPAHDDRSPSLSITESETGNALVHCHAGCTTADVARVVGLSVADLFPAKAPKVTHIGSAGRFKASYNYYDAEGELRYRVVRYEPKTFRQQHMVDGRWVGGRGPNPRLLYNLPQVLAAKREGRLIVITEGEKDAENVQWLAKGAVGTTAPEGAGKWEDTFTDALSGARRIVIVADRDKPGYEHARHIARALAPKVGELTVVEPATGKDLSDHMNANLGHKDLVELWSSKAPNGWLEEGSESETKDEPEQVFIDWSTFWDEDTAEDWLAEPLIPAGRGVAIYAPAKAGKSLLVLDVVAALAAGRPCLGQPAKDPVHVMYLDYEMTRDDIRDRLSDMGYWRDDDLSHLHYWSLPSLPPLDTPEGAQAVLIRAAECQAELVVIDTLSRVISSEENESGGILDLYKNLGVPLKSKGVALVRLDHAGKNLEKGSRGSSAKNDDVDVVWQLTDRDGDVQLKATHRRVNWVPQIVSLTRRDDPLQHAVVRDSEVYPTGTKELAAVMDRLGIPVGASKRDADKALKEAGEGKGSVLVLAALRWRRAELPAFLEGPESVPGGLRNTSETVPQEHPQEHLTEMASELPRNTLRNTQEHLAGQVGNTAFPPRGNAVPQPPPADDEILDPAHLWD